MPVTHELVCLICSQCSLETLVTLARTSRLCHGPAIRVIWRHIPYLACLFYTLPSDSWTSDRMVLKPTRELFPKDFIRFDMHAALVLEVIPMAEFAQQWNIRLKNPMFIPPSGEGIRISKEMWAALQRISLTPLPNVHRMSYTGRTVFKSEQSAPIHVLLGPSLHRAKIVLTYDTIDWLSTHSDMTDYDVTLTQMIRTLPIRCPDLTHLNLYVFNPHSYHHTHLKDALADALCGLHKLAKVECGHMSLNLRAWKCLGSLPTLKSLRFLAFSEDFPAGSSQSEPTPLFPTLHELTIHVDSYELCASLMEAVSSPTLQSVQCQIKSLPEAAPFEVLTATLAAHPSGTSIKALAINTGIWSVPSRPRREQHDPLPLPKSAFSALTSLSSLETFWLAGVGYAALDDDVAAQLARAWPNICELAIGPLNSLIAGPDFPEPYHSQVTARSLAHFARHCPRLVRLAIALDDLTAASIPSLSPSPKPDPSPSPSPSPTRRPSHGTASSDVLPQHPLLYLSVGRPRVGASAVTALGEYLGELFPQLRHIVHSWPSAPGAMQVWTAEQLSLSAHCEKASRYMCAIRVVRQQERTWRATRLVEDGPQ